MSANPNPGSTAEAELWNERDWDDLLDDIADCRVIPIIGSELSVIEVDGESVPLYRLVAERLADRLHLPAHPLLQRRTLNSVVCDYLDADRSRNTADRVYSRLCEVFHSLALDPPPTLLKLAQITHFGLYVTTSPDSLLESAVNAARFGGVKGSASLAFNPRAPEDLPAPHKSLECPAVYHLLGKLAKTPDQFVVSDEDMLEFFYALQGAADRLPNLFDALRENHLLFLGGAFSDWLARFFLRTAKRLRLSEKKSYDLVAADRLVTDPQLVLFLRIFTNKTRITGHDPIGFVDELHRRWRQRHPASSTANATTYVPPPPKMPRDAIFISYASEDRPRVQKLKAALDAAGLTVWFDKDQLMAGDDWEDEIETNIRRSVLFLPVISHNTQRWRHDVYFRAEWNYADDIARRSDPTSKFIVPVMLDSIAVDAASIPKSFRTKNFEPVLDGDVNAEFIGRLRLLVEERLSQARRRPAAEAFVI